MQQPLIVKKAPLIILGLILSVFVGTGVLLAQSGSDIVAPSDVENVKAEPLDEAVKLTWDASTDNVGVVSYVIYYGSETVDKEGEEYNLPSIIVDKATSKTVDFLTNGTTYYFGMTAMDAAGNESEKYSLEVSAKPEKGLRASSLEDDGQAPQIATAEAVSMVEVKIVFSEPILLPLEVPESAFAVKDKDDAVLQVQLARMDVDDPDGKTVILTTAPQTEDTEYTVTAGIEIEDHFGNAVKAGTADKGTFAGKGAALTASVDGNTEDDTTEDDENDDKTPPVIENVEATESNKIEVVFSEALTEPADLVKHFTVRRKDDDTPLLLTGATISIDGKTVFLTTDPQEAVEYEVSVSGIRDTAGNEISTLGNITTLRGSAASIADLIPPEDVTEFVATVADPGKSTLVSLSWTASKNTAGDLKEHTLYKAAGDALDASKGSGAFGEIETLGKTAVKSSVKDLEPGEYTFKLTASDEVGNESKGVLASVTIPEVGPAVLFLGAISLGIGRFLRRRKKNSQKNHAGSV